MHKFINIFLQIKYLLIIIYFVLTYFKFIVKQFKICIYFKAN